MSSHGDVGLGALKGDVVPSHEDIRLGVLRGEVVSSHEDVELGVLRGEVVPSHEDVGLGVLRGEVVPSHEDVGLGVLGQKSVSGRSTRRRTKPGRSSVESFGGSKARSPSGLGRSLTTTYQLPHLLPSFKGDQKQSINFGVR